MSMSMFELFWTIELILVSLDAVGYLLILLWALPYKMVVREKEVFLASDKLRDHYTGALLVNIFRKLCLYDPRIYKMGDLYLYDGQSQSDHAVFGAWKCSLH